MINTTDRKFLSIFNLILLVTTIICGLLLIHSPVSAKSNWIYGCEKKDGIAEVFYNFENLYIVLTEFPHPDFQKKTNYVDELKFPQFRDALSRAVTSNFSKCLNSENESKKKVFFISLLPAVSVKDRAVQVVEHGGYQPVPDFAWKDLHAAENLTVFVRVIYDPDYKMPGQDAIAQISYFFYRPDVSYPDAQIPLMNNSGMYAFTPNNTYPTKLLIHEAFKGIAPAWVGTPPKE